MPLRGRLRTPAWRGVTLALNRWGVDSEMHPDCSNDADDEADEYSTEELAPRR